MSDLDNETDALDTTDNVREVQQARASATKLATLAGKAGQWIIEKVTWRPHIMDGTTLGGHTLAFESELLTKVTSLSQELIDHVLEVLGIYDALEELITENGGTVPTDANTVQTMSAQTTSADPWADLV